MIFAILLLQINWDAREDDEISIKLRSLQKELRDVMKVNKSRKQRLLGLVNNHLAYQEYNTILDDLDKQVEQGYLKRFVSQGTDKWLRGASSSYADTIELRTLTNQVALYSLAHDKVQEEKDFNA